MFCVLYKHLLLEQFPERMKKVHVRKSEKETFGMSLRPQCVRTMQLLAGLACIGIIAASLEAQTPADAEKPSAKGLTPESVILNLPAGPGEAPLPVTLRQMMSIYRVPGSSSEKPQEFKLNSETGESGGVQPSQIRESELPGPPFL